MKTIIATVIMLGISASSAFADESKVVNDSNGSSSHHEEQSIDPKGCADGNSYLENAVKQAFGCLVANFGGTQAPKDNNSSPENLGATLP